MLKSSLYDECSLAVKFVNRERVPYPWYFERVYAADGSTLAATLPVGKIVRDLGPVENDFRYLDARIASTGYGETDASGARAFEVELEGEGIGPTAVCVTHETGLELFLLSAATFVGLEAAKYSLERLLETLEERINRWMSARRREEGEEPIVRQIAIRTRDWELTLDGRFTPRERQALLAAIATSLDAEGAGPDHPLDIADPSLRLKADTATRRVTCDPP